MRKHVTIYPEVKMVRTLKQNAYRRKGDQNVEFTEIIKNLYKTIYFIYGRITKHQIGGCI